jgi:hypothetical protein
LEIKKKKEKKKEVLKDSRTIMDNRKGGEVSNEK